MAAFGYQQGRQVPSAPPPSYDDATGRQQQYSEPASNNPQPAVLDVSGVDRIPKACGCLLPTVTFTFSGLLIMLIISLTIGMVMAGILSENKSTKTLGDYRETTCEVKKVTERTYFDRTISCSFDSSIPFPCWEVDVYATSEYGHKLTVELLEKEKDVEDFAWCSVRPPCYRYPEERQQYINHFLQRYGRVGNTFTCYEYDNLDKAIVDRPPEKTNWGYILAYLIPCILIAVFVLLLFLLCRSAGGPSKLCEAYKIQREVQQEIYQGMIALGAQARRGNIVIRQ